MLVKDLIYLLQTRANPNDEVWLSGYVATNKKKVKEIMCQVSDDFSSVYSEEIEHESGKIESICKINVECDQLLLNVHEDLKTS